MASKSYKILFNRGRAQTAFGEGATEVFTKTQVEAAPLTNKGGKEPFIITGPIEECKMVEVTAETEAAAAYLARIALGFTTAEGEVLAAESNKVKSITTR